MSARKRRNVSSADIAIFRASLLNLARKQETIVVADRIGKVGSSTMIYDFAFGATGQCRRWQLYVAYSCMKERPSPHWRHGRLQHNDFFDSLTNERTASGRRMQLNLKDTADKL